MNERAREAIAEEPARRLLAAWAGLGAAFAALAAALIVFRDRFDWAAPLRDIPALPLAAGCVAAGVLFLAVPLLVRRTLQCDPGLQRRVLWLVVVVGLLLRVMMFPTEPALEDDQQRYLWEGGLAAHGISPYAVSPEAAKQADRASALGQLAEMAGPVLDRVNHPRLKTIYPPVAMASFAVAHWIGPFSLAAWRFVLLAAEGATLVLILTLLREASRAPLWAALYWWNPLAIKEIMNSGHMEGILTPFVLAALLLAIRRRPFWSMTALALAVGIKIWPLLLAPLLLRPWIGRWRTLAGALAVLAALTALWTIPIWLGGLDQTSGFVAYAERWQAVSALLPTLRTSLAGLLEFAGTSAVFAGPLTRALLAGSAAVTALVLAWRADGSAADLLRRAALLTLVLVLVSPAQFPWYMLWTLPLLPFAPRLGVSLMAVLLPLYYVSFYLSAHDAYDVFRDRVVWLIWLPIWFALAYEAATRRSARETDALAR